MTEGAVYRAIYYGLRGNYRAIYYEYGLYYVQSRASVAQAPAGTSPLL